MVTRNFRALVFSLAIAGAVTAAGAAPVPSPATLPSRLPEALACVSPAADYHGVNPWILRAILKVESDFNPRALNRNANGTMDVGMAQINSIHFDELARWGIAPANLMDGCVASYVAAWHLARQIRAHGNSWFAVASYHSTTPCQNSRYAGLLWNVLAGWGVVPGPRLKVPGASQCKNAQRGARDTHANPPAPKVPALAFDEAR